MATHKSAIKRHKQSLRRRVSNRSVKSRINTAAKRVMSRVEENDLEGARQALRTATIIINKAASKKVIHKNTASRKISRLTRKVNGLAEAS